MYSLPVRIYYEDTDAGGIVYHASYVRFLERGRTEYLRAIGLDQSQLMTAEAGRPLLFVVRRMTVDYLRPAKLDDVVTVTTAVKTIGGASMELIQSVLRGDERRVGALVTVVAIGADGRPRRIGAEVRGRFLGTIQGMG